MVPAKILVVEDETIVARDIQQSLTRLGYDVLATTVRCMSDAMITTNRGGRLTYMSQAAQALTGWLQQDAMGAELTTMLSFEEDGPAQVIENPAMQAMMECRIVRFDRVTLRAKEGTTRPVAGSTAPVIDDAGVVIGSV